LPGRALAIPLLPEPGEIELNSILVELKITLIVARVQFQVVLFLFRLHLFPFFPAHRLVFQLKEELGLALLDQEGLITVLVKLAHLLLGLFGFALEDVAPKSFHKFVVILHELVLLVFDELNCFLLVQHPIF